MDTCAEAEIYAALMRMQSAVMALMELSKLPCTYLFTAYLERIAKTVSNEEIRGSAVKLIELLLSEKSAQPQTSFFDMVNQSMAQHFALSPEHQATIQQKVMPMQQIFAICAQHLKPNDLMMFASIIQELNTEGNAMLTSKLTFKFFKEVGSEVSAYTFTPALYQNLEADMTDVPFGFTDDYDFYQGVIYFNEDVSAWNRIGIQATYTGGGETHTTDIQWVNVADVMGINSVQTDRNNGRNAIYNLNGQRVNNATKGLYIINGKKVVIK